MLQKRGRRMFEGCANNPPRPLPEYSIAPPSSETAKDISETWVGISSRSNNAARFGYVFRLKTMNPVSTGMVRLPSATKTVLEWPPGRSARSYTVTRCRWLRSHAAASPEMPAPTMAMLRERTGSILCETPGDRSVAPGGGKRRVAFVPWLRRKWSAGSPTDDDPSGPAHRYRGYATGPAMSRSASEVIVCIADAEHPSG